VCRTNDKTIRCSSGAVRALLDETLWSIGLFFVLAHELAHIQRGHSAAFAPAIERMNLAWDVQRKGAALDRACDSSKPFATQEEAAADAQAGDVLLQVLDRRFADDLSAAWFGRQFGSHNPTCAASGFRYELLAGMIRAVEAWQRAVQGLAATSFTTRASELICGKSGWLEYPSLGVHPSALRRFHHIIQSSDRTVVPLLREREAKSQQSLSGLFPSWNLTSTPAETLPPPPPSSPGITIHWDLSQGTPPPPSEARRWSAPLACPAAPPLLDRQQLALYAIHPCPPLVEGSTPEDFLQNARLRQVFARDEDHASTRELLALTGILKKLATDDPAQELCKSYAAARASKSDLCAPSSEARAPLPK
jgi:hypothetical protein